MTQPQNWLANGCVYALALAGATWAFREGRKKDRHPVTTGLFFGMVMGLAAFVLGMTIFFINEDVANAAYPALRVCMIGGWVLSLVCVVIGLVIGGRDERKLKAKPVDQGPDADLL